MKALTSAGRTRPLSDTKPLGFYYNASQLRFDTWHRVKRETVNLAEKHARKRETERLRTSIEKSLELLEAMEDYTAFPSKDDFRYLWKLFEKEEYATLARVVGRLVRALVSHSYRTRTIELTQSVESSEFEEEQDFQAEPHDRDTTPSRPYFELLVVDELSAQEE